MTLREIKIRAIEQAMVAHGGNKTKAAKELDVSIRWLRNWIIENPRLWHWKIEAPRRFYQSSRRAA